MTNLDRQFNQIFLLGMYLLKFKITAGCSCLSGGWVLGKAKLGKKLEGNWDLLPGGLGTLSTAAFGVTFCWFPQAEQ